MASTTELLKLSRFDIAITPNPFEASAYGTQPYFNQTLDLATATLHLFLGGANLSTHALHIAVYVDANADTLRVTAAAGPSFAPFSLRVASFSTRPATNWTHAPPFFCSSALTLPDVYLDPLPPAQGLGPAAPLREADRLRHAGGGARPLRRLHAPGGPLHGKHGKRTPTSFAFQPGSIIAFHRNDVHAEGGTGSGTLATVLAQQGLSALLPTTPDHWTDLQSGFVLDGDDGVPLVRLDARTLASAAPAAAFSLRATVLAVQTASPEEWVADLAALVATTPASAAARSAHEAWWAAWWARSYIAVNASNFPPSLQPEGEQRAAAAAAAATAAVPPAGAALWLRASDLRGANSTPVAQWSSLSQPNASLQPLLITDAFGPGAAGVRFDGKRAFLGDAGLALPGEDSTHFAVFRDRGSSSACCSGVVFFQGGACVGISTATALTADDDDQSPGRGLPPVVAMADFPGSETKGTLNLANRPAVVEARYSAAGGVELTVDGCAQAQAPAHSSRARGVMVGTRNNELGRFFKGDIGEVLVYPWALNASEAAAVRAYLAQQWPQAPPPRSNCTHRPSDTGFLVSKVYAVTRYTQAVQSRNTLWPIKFNGMAFVAAMGEAGEPDYRDWGACNWWQNTRLPYGAMLAAGDADSMRVILDYYANAEVLLSQRTQYYWNHSGMWTTETHHLSGACA